MKVGVHCYIRVGASTRKVAQLTFMFLWRNFALLSFFLAQFCLFFFLFGSIYNEQNQSHFGMIYSIQRLKQLFFKESQSESESTQIETKHNQLLISVMRNCDNSLISISVMKNCNNSLISISVMKICDNSLISFSVMKNCDNETFVHIVAGQWKSRCDETFSGVILMQCCPHSYITVNSTSF